MLPRIAEVAKELEASVAKMKAVLVAEQRKCPHKRVIHSKWRASEWASAFKARRLCLDCGLEEEAKNSGYGDSDGDFPRLKTGGFHKLVDSNELCRARFPEAEVG